MSPTLNPDATTGWLDATIVDAADRAPVPGARVSFHGAIDGETVSRGAGQLRLTDLPPGEYRLTIERDDYAVQRLSATIEAGAVSALGEIALTRQRAVAVGSARAAPTATPTGGRRYTVRPGDTLANIAVAAGTTTRALLALNPLADPNRLRAGQVLVLPPSSGGVAARGVAPAGG